MHYNFRNSKKQRSMYFVKTGLFLIPQKGEVSRGEFFPNMGKNK